MDKISIILPVYNVEKYVEKCLNSIKNQDYKNFEAIIVDDGSKDKSVEIIENFIKKDDRFKLYHKENGGLSDARNFGMNFVTGKFVIFIDSDDYIENKMLTTLYENITKEKADVSICGIYNVYINKKTSQCEDKNIYFVCDKNRFLKEYLIGKLVPGSICNKLIKVDIAKKIQFPVGKIYEDAFYQFDLINFAKKYVVTTNPMYNYFHRENSITTKSYSKKNLDYIEIYSKFYDYVKSKNIDLEKEAFFRLSYSYFIILDKMLLEDDYHKIDKYNEVLNFLKKNYFKIFKNDYFRFTRRIASIALKININLYKFLLLKDLKKNKGVN